MPFTGEFGYTVVMVDAPQKRVWHWFRITPDRLVVGLLAAECFLLLSERFRWFAFNERKGYSLLIAVASVAATMLLMLLWFGVSLVFRRRFQFSLRALLLLAVVVAIPCSLLAAAREQARIQWELVTETSDANGYIAFDNPMDCNANTKFYEEPPGPQWLRKLLGEQLFVNVSMVGLCGTVVDTDALLGHIKGFTQIQWLLLTRSNVSDAGLEHLEGLNRLRSLDLDGTMVSDTGLEHFKGLPNLQQLNLSDTRVSDAGLEHLKGLTKLRWLGLAGTKVSDAGVRNLQKALPNVQIDRGNRYFDNRGNSYFGNWGNSYFDNRGHSYFDRYGRRCTSMGPIQP